MPDAPTKKIYSLSEIAQILDVDERQLHRLAHKGLIDPKLSNNTEACFKEIDCIRLKTILQADELGYEPEAIFRLLGKPDEVLAAEDPIATCEDFAMTLYKQIYDELNHCEPLEQLNKQCDLKLLIGYINNLKALRTGVVPDHREKETATLRKPSSTVKGVKASMGEPNQAPESAPSPSIRTYSVAKYWEYMKKVEELQKEVAADSSPDDDATLTDLPYDAEDVILPSPKDLADQPPEGRDLDDDSERSEAFQRPARVFDKQQSWGVWILAGAFLLLIAAGYFFMTGTDEKASETVSPQATHQVPEPSGEQQLPAEGLASRSPEEKALQTEDGRTDTAVSQANLEVANLNLWHDSRNNIYRADFTITKNQNAEDGGPVSGYAFVFIGLGDNPSDPKSLILPTGEMQVSQPAEIRRGARFTIKRFKQMQVTTNSALPANDVALSNVLIYSPDGKLILEKSFNVSVHTILSESEQPTTLPEEKGGTEVPLAQIEPREPSPPPTVVPQTPPSNLKDSEIAPPATAAEPTPVVTKSGSASEAPPAATTRPQSGIEEKTLAEVTPESRGATSLRDSGNDHSTSEAASPSSRIHGTGNPEAATWEQRSYNAAVRGDFEQAIASASKAIELDPGRVNAYINRSWAYLEKNMLEAAINDCKKALLIDPQNAFAYNNRGLVYHRKGKMSLAEKDYTKACDLGLELGCQNLDELTKQSRISKLIDQSQVAFNSKNWESVIRITTEVIDLDPQNAVAYTNRSAAYAQKDFLNKALKDSNQAIKFNPDFSLAYNNRGYVLELLGNNRQASVDYLKSCSLGLDLGCKNYERLNRAQ